MPPGATPTASERDTAVMARQVPAVEGLLELGEQPHLVGRRCTTCGTYLFPFVPVACPNPGCAGTDFEEVALSRSGRIWSFTDARYQPPPPYVAGDTFEPFAIAAVELAAEGLVVLGQVAAGFTVDDLDVGMEVELATEPLFRDPDGTEHMVWRWRPAGAEPSHPAPEVPVLEDVS